jgi:hypothetical protein
MPSHSKPVSSRHLGAHTDLDGHGCEIIRSAEIGAPKWNSLTRIARHNHAYEMDTINDLSRETGMSQDELLTQLSQALPEAVDKLTPGGNMPDHADLLAGPREEDLDDRG